jgi:hypothetical protein
MVMVGFMFWLGNVQARRKAETEESSGGGGANQAESAD